MVPSGQHNGFMSWDPPKAMVGAKSARSTRCGIGIVRWTLVEMVWRLMIWQPQYPPVRRLAAGFVKGKRAKKRLVVQTARRLAIALWRL